MLNVRRGDSGFTLIELLIVIAVIGVLAAIAVPVFLNQEASAQAAALQADLDSASSLLSVAAALDEPLPASFPAGQVTTVAGAGSLDPAQTLTVVDDGVDVCVEGVTPSGDVWSKGFTSGLRNAPCTSGPGPDPDPSPTPPPPVFTLSYSSTSFTQGASETLGPTVANGTAPYTFSVTEGVLPTDVSLDADTGALTGPDPWPFEVAQIATGGNATCAVDLDSQVWCWGANAGLWGGTGSTNANSPTLVPFVSDVSSVSLGTGFACAVLNNGGVRCWGVGTNGVLGNGSTTASHTAAVTPTGLPSVRFITSWATRTCAITVEGATYCWGSQLNGSTFASTTPVLMTSPTGGGYLSGMPAPGALSDTNKVVKVVLAAVSTCVLHDSGNVFCWGTNTNGQLGTGGAANSLTGVVRVDTGSGANDWLTGVVDLTTAGLGSTTALYIAVTNNGSVGSVYKWGTTGGPAILGLSGVLTYYATPVTTGALAPWPNGADRGIQPSQTTCQVAPSLCSGAAPAVTLAGNTINTNLGFITSDGSATYATNGTNPLTSLPSAPLTFSSGTANHQCAVPSSGAAFCWGTGNVGQLGTGVTEGTQVFPAKQAATTGTVAGFPSTITVTVTDAAGQTASQTVTLTVASA